MLKTDSLCIGYDRPIVRDINIEIRSPAVVQVMGPNGAGKTTFLRTLIGVLRPLSGRITINDEDITGKPEKAGKFVSYVPQIATYILGNVFPITAWEFVAFEAEAHAMRIGVKRSAVPKIVEEALSMVGIPRELWHRGIDKLSGGQRQRLLIARALIKDAPVMAMDEPLSAIDIEGRTVMAHMVGKLREMGKIVIVTCHDPVLLLPHTDYIMILGGGSYVFGKPDEVLTPGILDKMYKSCFAELEKHIHIYDYHI